MIVVRAIKPKKAFNSAVFRQELIAEATELGEFVKKDYEKTTRTWKHKPEFRNIVKTSGKAVELSVTTSDKIYGYVDEGTKPHIIRPRTKKALAFSSKFRPKTRPRQIRSLKGYTGKVDTVRPEVHHPGTEAREFTETLTERWKPGFQRGIQNAIDRAVKRSGYAI